MTPISFQSQIQQLEQQRKRLDQNEQDYFNKRMAIAIKIQGLKHEEEKQEKTFKKERMYEYVQKANEYAKGDTSLFDRINHELNCPEFQTNPEVYLKNWEKTLRKLETNTLIVRGAITEPCSWKIKKDRAFDFFKEQFIWW